VCLNFVEGGGCYATGGRCLLGPSGASARNKDAICDLHGNFDVWLTEADDLLITDLGFPSEEPKQCLALGVNEALAREVAAKKAHELGTSIHTSEHRCSRCQKSYWVSEHTRSSGLLETSSTYFCPDCIRNKSISVESKLGVQQYWCG
jgi:hypothetical protein